MGTKGLSKIGKIVFFINGIVAVLLLLAYLLPLLPPRTFSILAVVNLGVPFLILTNALFLLYWLLRRKKQLFLSLSVLIMGYFLYGSIYKFSSSKHIEDADNIKVMNYNVRLFNLYDWIPEKGLETKIQSLIQEEAPQILCIQEFYPHENLDFSFYKYKYEKLSGKKIQSGQVIFSQFPIINKGSVEFPNTSNNAIYADILKSNDTLRIYNIHLESMHINTDTESLKNEDSERLFNRISNTFKTQQTQAELIENHRAKCGYKTILCGDFNNTAYSYVYRKIKGELKDTYKEAGNGFGRTYNLKFLPARIDFIFSDKDFSINGFKSYEEYYSDHYPIMATLSLNNVEK